MVHNSLCIIAKEKNKEGVNNVSSTKKPLPLQSIYSVTATILAEEKRDFQRDVLLQALCFSFQQWKWLSSHSSEAGALNTFCMQRKFLNKFIYGFL